MEQASACNGGFSRRFGAGAEALVAGMEAGITWILIMGRTGSAEETIALCERGEYVALIGLVESQEFEFKGSPYRLDEDAQKREFAKDVSGLANAGGGVILVGAKPAPPGAIPLYGEEVGEICPFPRDLFNEKQHRDVLRSWTYPQLDGVSFRFYGDPQKTDYGILLISVPKAVSPDWPVLANRPVDFDKKTSGTVFGYYQRRETDVEPTSVERLHSLLRAGLEREVDQHKLAGIEDMLSELLGRSQRIAAFAEGENRRRAELIRIRQFREMEPVFKREMEDALEKSGLREAPHVLLAVYPREGADLSRFMSSVDQQAGELLRNPYRLRDGGFDLNIRDYEEVRTRDTRGVLRKGFKLREVSQQGLVVVIHQGGDWFLSWNPMKPPGRPYLISSFVLSEFVFLFSVFAKQVFESSAIKSGNLACRIKLGNMGESGQPPRILPAELSPNGFAFGTVLEAPSFDFDDTFEVPSEISSGHLAYRFAQRVYQWFGFWESIPYSREVDGQLVIDGKSLRLKDEAGDSQ